MPKWDARLTLARRTNVCLSDNCSGQASASWLMTLPIEPNVKYQAVAKIYRSIPVRHHLFTTCRLGVGRGDMTAPTPDMLIYALLRPATWQFLGVNPDEPQNPSASCSSHTPGRGPGLERFFFALQRERIRRALPIGAGPSSRWMKSGCCSGRATSPSPKSGKPTCRGELFRTSRRLPPPCGSTKFAGSAANSY